MLILKKINNNVALASTDAGEEIVVFGKGVGFHEMPYELEDETVIQRVFRDVDEKSIDGFEAISDEVLLVASDIVALADKALDCKLAGNLVISLADHLQYAVERAGDGVSIENPLSHEVAFVYPRETELGHRGVEIVLDRLGVELPESRGHLHRPPSRECRGRRHGQRPGHGPRHEEHRHLGARHADHRGSTSPEARSHLLRVCPLRGAPALPDPPPHARRLQARPRTPVSSVRPPAISPTPTVAPRA